MRFIHFPSIACFACVLVAAVAPAEAWDKGECLQTDGTAAFRNAVADKFFNVPFSLKPPIERAKNAIEDCKGALTRPWPSK
jgi:hypothetical protein